MDTRAFVRPVVGTVVALLLVVLVLVLTTRSDSRQRDDARDTSASPGAQSPDQDEPEQTTGVQPDAIAPSTLPMAVRPGTTVDPALVAPDTRLGETAVYPDGVEVTVSGVSRKKVEGQGPGSINATLTIFEVTVDNASTKKLDLTRVVMTVVYGAEPGRLADPSYDVDVQDFATILTPGKSATTRYAFNIPDDGLGSVTLHADLDGEHTPAVFTGAVPQ